MRNHEILILPTVIISDVEPVLADETRVYASTLKAKFTDKLTLNISEKLGANIEAWDRLKAECLFEIVDAEFSFPPPPDSEEKTDPNLIEFKYLGFRNSCHFFPIPEAAKVNGQVDRQLYRTLSEEQFANYGESGFGLKPFDNQPILKSASGFSFVVNKFLFKDFLKKVRKGTWLLAKINEVELLSIAEPTNTEQSILPMNREEEQQLQAEAMKVPRKKRFGVF